MTQRTVSISIDELRVGVTCSHSIEDDDGLLLLGSGTKITHQVINGLRDRGITAIEVDPRDLAVLRGGGKNKKKAPSKRERNTVDDRWGSSQPVKEMLVDRHDEGLSDQRTAQLQTRLEMARGAFDSLKQTMTKEKLRNIVDLNDISNSYARSIVDDLDQTVGVIGNSAQSGDPGERSVRMAVLGMAVAVELGLDGPRTLEVGMTGLLHDLGLYAMGPRFRKPVEQMNEQERWEYRKHPLVSVLCVSEVMDVPAAVQLAMQQVHEQFDGSGYPRGVGGQRIHRFARILNVVDAYLQLTSPSFDRRGIVPHDALGLMLHQASRGVFDPRVVRAFLNVETLFPLGSVVELNSGDVARVIRRPRGGFAEPVLEDMDGKRIELESERVEVVRPVCDPNSAQVRITPQFMASDDWHPADRAVLA
jgi:HD-GYP domain-containing protein (c-di-GMP phosphodiesterase class II)